MFEIDFFGQNEEAIIQLANENLRHTESWQLPIWQFIADWFNPEITTIKVFTSGSTGTPKQIEHAKKAMIYSASLTVKALELKPGDKALLCLPVQKIGGMMMMVRSIYSRLKLVCLKPSTKPLSELPENYVIDFAAFTPMQFHEITTSYSNFKKAEQVKKIILGGEDMRADLMNSIHDLENQVFITFGMTETISHIALKRLNGLHPDQNFKVLTGIKISSDARDCLVIQAPELGQPYLVTNDIVKLVDEDQFQWLGRIDNVINSGGIKIYPEEIEQQLTHVIDVPFFVASLPDKVSGERLVLAIEKEILNSDNKNELIRAFENLEKIKRPKNVLLISHFIRTPNGKIKRKESLNGVIEKIDLFAAI